MLHLRLVNNPLQNPALRMQIPIAYYSQGLSDKQSIRHIFMCLIPIKSHALGRKISVDFMNGAYLPMEHDAIPMDISGLY